MNLKCFWTPLLCGGHLCIHPKGFAYVEFSDKDSVSTAMALDDSLFRGRQIKVRNPLC